MVLLEGNQKENTMVLERLEPWIKASVVLGWFTLIAVLCLLVYIHYFDVLNNIVARCV